jgi:hypothetical protein
MAYPNSAAPNTPAASSPKFKDMGIGGKIVFIGKFIIFVCSFGFAFPTLLND